MIIIGPLQDVKPSRSWNHKKVAVLTGTDRQELIEFGDRMRIPSGWFENSPECPFYRLTEGLYWQCRKAEVNVLTGDCMVTFFHDWRRLHGPNAETSASG